MKNYFLILIQALVASLIIPAVQAQAPPGWGWVNKLGTFVPNATQANSVAGLGRDAAGNLYLLGNYVGTPVLSGEPTTNLGSSEIFLAKYNPAGTLLWLRMLQSTGDDGAAALMVEPSGRCTVTGAFGGRTGDNLSFTGFGGTPPGLPGPSLLGLAAPGGNYGSLSFIATVDANGALLWADSPSSTYGLSVSSICRDASGNSYISANTSPQSVLTINSQSYPAIGTGDAVLIKYNTSGQIEWARRVGAVGGFTYSGPVKTDAANAVYWTVNHNRTLQLDGRTVPFVTPANPVTQGSNTLVKISPNNVIKWTKGSILKSGNNNALGNVLAIDQNQNAIYLSGGSYGGTVADQTNTLTLPIPAGSFGTCIAKCDTSGTVQWVRPFAYASTVPNGATWAAVGIINFFPDASGYTALTNTAYAAQTVFPPNNTLDFSRNGLPCVVRYTYSTNQFDWIRTGGLAGNFNGSSLGSSAIGAAIDTNGNVFVAGNFTGVAQFGTTTIASTNNSQQEIFFAKLDQSVLTTTRAGANAQPWTVFPNPTTGTVQLTGLPAQAQVRVYDALGRLVRELPAASSNAPRTLSGLTSGLYLLHVTHTSEVYQNQRLVVE